MRGSSPRKGNSLGTKASQKRPQAGSQHGTGQPWVKPGQGVTERYYGSGPHSNGDRPGSGSGRQASRSGRGGPIAGRRRQHQTEAPPGIKPQVDPGFAGPIKQPSLEVPKAEQVIEHQRQHQPSGSDRDDDRRAPHQRPAAATAP